MDLKKSALIPEIAGGIAVIIGLLFVGFELRQNTLVSRVTATRTLVTPYENALDVIAWETDAAWIDVRGINGLENLESVERLRFFVMWFQIFRAAEQLHDHAADPCEVGAT